VAKYKKKRARELQHDRFRDTTIGLLDRLGNALEGKGKTILYGLGGALVLVVLIVVVVKWNGRKGNEARQALGRAIDISTATISQTPTAGSTGFTFPSEQDRSRKAIEEFEKVAAKYGDPYNAEARYFIATNRLIIDRQKGMTELAEVGNKASPEVAALAKRIPLRGLMAIPPVGSAEEMRPYFRELRALRDECGLQELSMGMTDDFEVAIEEGATIIRVGRAIFGNR